MSAWGEGLGSPSDLDFGLLFEASPEVLLVLLPDAPRFTMVAATEARLRATHTTREGTLGRGLFEVFPDNPEDPGASGTSNLRASLERVVATREADTMAVQKYDIRGPDGSFQSKYWSPKNIPVLSSSGELRYILHRVEDVTDLVTASELGQQLRDRSTQMERDVVQRSRELADAIEKLRGANAKLGELDVAKTAFFSNVSHEFRTPLTLILGPLESALSRRPQVLSGEELASVHRNANRLLRLVNSLLDFSRIEAGRLNLRFAPTDLARLTAGLAGAFQSLFDDAGLRLKVSSPPLPERIYVDPAQWEKIVLNLVSNAFKFTFEGEVEVSLAWQGDHVELRVRDTGTGIPREELPRLFERFHRVQGARGRSYEGSGIGLALVHSLVQLHHGSISVDSEPERGTTFTVSLPVGSAHLLPEQIADDASGELSLQGLRNQVLEAKRWLRTGSAPEAIVAEPSQGPQLETSAIPSSVAALPSKRWRVLVADDNADMRDYVTRLLAPHWEVEVVVDGLAALNRIREAPPDLVLSDVMMPRMDGASLVSALRADERLRTVPVILLSARAGEEARLEGLETGADDYLVKPFSARELVARVNTHLEMTNVRRAAADAARELAETRALLVDELEQKNRDLKASYEQLAAAQAQLVQSAKMASLGALVAGIAHEINNPLAFAVSHLNTVARSLAAVQAELGPELERGPQAQWQRALQRLTEVQQGLARIQELVLKLRTFSRLDDGELGPASVRESINSVLAILAHRIDGRIQITTQIGEPDQIDCYASLLNQALMNLLSNAIDSIRGDGTIRIETGARGHELAISITDTGCGIPDAIHDRIFEPFFTTKGIGEGTGLGLSITYGIIEKHGGRIELLPAEGGGTCALIHLPLDLAGLRIP